MSDGQPDGDRLHTRRPDPRNGMGPSHRIDAVAHHFLPDINDVSEEERRRIRPLLVATDEAGRATAAWCARLVRAAANLDSLEKCRVIERIELEWSVGSYFPGKLPEVSDSGSATAWLPPIRQRGWRWDFDGVCAGKGDPTPPIRCEILHLGEIADPYLEWLESATVPPGGTAPVLIWCPRPAEGGGLRAAHRLGRLIRCLEPARLDLVFLRPGWPTPGPGWRGRMRRWLGPARDRSDDSRELAGRIRAVAPDLDVQVHEWSDPGGGPDRDPILQRILDP